MRHILDARLLLLAGAMVFASGCRTFVRRHTGPGEARAEVATGASVEGHEVRLPAEKEKASVPAKAKGTVRLAAAGKPVPAPKEKAKTTKPAKAAATVGLVPAGKMVLEAKKKEREKWFGRFGLLGFVYEIELDRDYGTTWALGRRVGDQGWFVEGEVTVPRAEYDFTGKEGGDRFEVEDTGRIFLYYVNVGKECYLDEAKQYRYRFHGGLGWMNATSITDNDTSFSATAGGAFEMRLYKNIWGHAGVSYYGFDTDLGRNTSEWRHNLGVNLSIVIDF